MIRDQAAQLREQPRPDTRRSGRDATPAIVIGSGKGGVGKSVTATAFAAALAASGRRTLLVDGDQNLGNLHVLLGVRPDLTLAAVVSGDVTPEDLVIPVTQNLWFLPADSGAETLQGLGGTDRARLQRQVSTLYDDYDVVIIDAAAGLESVTRCAAMRATKLVVVTIPEATALTDAYALVKIVSRQLPDLPVDVLVNRTHSPDEGDAAYQRLTAGTERFLGRALGFLGTAPDDPGMRAEVADPRRLLAPAVAGPALSALATLAVDRLDLPPVRTDAPVTATA